MTNTNALCKIISASQPAKYNKMIILLVWYGSQPLMQGEVSASLLFCIHSYLCYFCLNLLPSHLSLLFCPNFDLSFFYHLSFLFCQYFDLSFCQLSLLFCLNSGLSSCPSFGLFFFLFLLHFFCPDSGLSSCPSFFLFFFLFLHFHLNQNPNLKVTLSNSHTIFTQ